MHFILASSSPRRKQILSMLGIDFEVKLPLEEEKAPAGLSVEDTVMATALEKQKGLEGDYIISCDTVVYIDGEILEKPKSENDAFNMLRKLSGRKHTVYSGLCVNGRCECVASDVYFSNLSDEEIWNYIHTGEPMDKAGSYAVQGLGACFVEKIDGDYFNVMGLPVNTLYQMLKNIGVNLI